MNKDVKEIIYLDEDFNIVTKEKAVIVKIVYKDGKIIFGVPQKSA